MAATFDPSSTRPPRSVPASLGKWIIEHRLGCGAAGDVYLAHHASLGRFAAIKILAPEVAKSADYVRRFHSEAVATARLQHPNLMHIYDVHSEGEWHAIIMEYIDGASLQDLLLRHGRLEPRLAVTIARDVARGLQHAHQNGIIHRDIKPGNILLGTHNPVLTDDLRVVLTDFGVCQDGSNDGRMIVGTPFYVSPEQARGEAADERSDLYSLGITLFLMLTGTRPFDGPSPRLVLRRQIEEAAPAMVRVAPDVPLALGPIVNRLLQKKREDRHPDTTALIRELDGFLDSGSTPLRMGGARLRRHTSIARARARLMKSR